MKNIVYTRKMHGENRIKFVIPQSFSLRKYKSSLCTNISIFKGIK
jgi:hypothetical protein